MFSIVEDFYLLSRWLEEIMEFCSGHETILVNILNEISLPNYSLPIMNVFAMIFDIKTLGENYLQKCAQQLRTVVIALSSGSRPAGYLRITKIRFQIRKKWNIRCVSYVKIHQLPHFTILSLGSEATLIVISYACLKLSDLASKQGEPQLTVPHFESS